MNWILSPLEIRPDDRSRIGPKAYALYLMAREGFDIPDSLFLTVDAYNAFVNAAGLRERILLELNRKSFKDMRWEEIWDCATRIRNLFLKKQIPDQLRLYLTEKIQSRFSGKTLAVRSSAPDEDVSGSSFAGLHESFVNVQGAASILHHIRLVWASLWSDAALLYRQEIGLEIEKSAMAVVLQETVKGNRSGVVFSQNPNDETQVIIESVYGLNQGLVDGMVEPDRWVLDRDKKTVLSHKPAQREQWMIPSENGVEMVSLPADLSKRPPLSGEEALGICDLAYRAEALFKAPQDVEWTIKNDTLYVLQSRSITTLSPSETQDKRAWYLSLHRSAENLKVLRTTIEETLIPEMIKTAKDLAGQDITVLSDRELADEVRRRWKINQHWVDTYGEEFIPYAHGVRLFGQYYNDAMRPDDPYEFMNLLTQTKMASLERNQLIQDLAAIIRQDRQLFERLKAGEPLNLDSEFGEKVNQFVEKFGDLSCAVTGGTECATDTRPLLKLLLEMAINPSSLASRKNPQDARAMQQEFLERFQGPRRDEAEGLLDLARSSYRLRDDDNIYLGKIEAQVLRAVMEAKSRVESSQRRRTPASELEDLKAVIQGFDYGTDTHKPPLPKDEYGVKVYPRQLVGQPAGPGLSKGMARVVHQHLDLQDFKHGEILVCDAVDPNMTFVIPLAAGVIERRGGMLIHGAIIAREYGLPCVTGVPEATSLIHTGDEITVDGFLGIVTISQRHPMGFGPAV
ncbi:PEP/pyruvate-binding domain-containing protein [Thermodesulfobacteriota bacterium]